MEQLPKETILRIEKEAKSYSMIAEKRQDYENGLMDEALRSLSEIEKLKDEKEQCKKDYTSIRLKIDEVDRQLREVQTSRNSLESQNKELMEALKRANDEIEYLKKTRDVKF